MDAKVFFAKLARDPKFWTAVLFLVQTLLFLWRPEFPAELWTALSGVLLIVFATLCGTQAVQAGRAAGRTKQ